jgi:hypothetical protein
MAAEQVLKKENKSSGEAVSAKTLEIAAAGAAPSGSADSAWHKPCVRTRAGLFQAFDKIF